MEIEWFPSDIELGLSDLVITTDFDRRGNAKLAAFDINHVKSLVEI
jgi:hypothetical protein